MDINERTVCAGACCSLIGLVNEYPTMHYFGNPSKKLRCGNVVNMPKYSVSDRLNECVLYYCSPTSAVSSIMFIYKHVLVTFMFHILMLYI